ncbi:LysR family transcriptional regulator [Burkholderia singularis]|uniref:LysR family transcriptional regulator n=1 Tax=Burkholderia singularis TaxID=1503053 RepID=UPI000B793F6F|nr:LysR family transcriptional regulator [Burkholderia singularis]
MATLTLRQLEQFLAVAETMSFHRAAERLNMAQPPLTAAIRQLESLLGVRLLERGNRVTALTTAGAVLREEARRTLDQAQRAIELTQRAGQGLIGALRIGFVASATRHVLPPLISRFRHTHPGVALDLTEATTSQQLAALDEDRIDAGIVVLPLEPEVGLHIAQRRLLKSRMVAVLSADHPLAVAPGRSVPLAALAREPWILFPPTEGPGLYATIVNACVAAGFAPHVVQRATQMDTIIGLVAANLGVGLVPEALASTDMASVKFRRLTGPGTPVPYEVALVWRRKDPNPTVAALVDSCTGQEV